MQKKSVKYVNSLFMKRSFQQCIDKGFLYNTHFLSFCPFFSVTCRRSTKVFLPHGMGSVGIFAVCLRSRLPPWYFNLTCEVCTIFIMLVLASLALNKSCVATRLMTGSCFAWWGENVFLNFMCLFRTLFFFRRWYYQHWTQCKPPTRPPKMLRTLEGEKSATSTPRSLPPLL